MSITITSLLELLEGEKLAIDRRKVKEAFALAEQLYGDELHWTGVSLLDHVSGVLSILLPFRPDEETVLACILQHALHPKRLSVTDLEEHVGTKVRSLVSGLHLLTRVTMKDRRGSIEDLRLMILSVSDDVRVVLLLLCERAFVLDHVGALDADEKRHIGQDVLSLFAPVAARLGIYSLKQRLERTAFPLVYPLDAEKIHEQLAGIHARTKPFLDQAAAALQRALREQGIEATVTGREKEIYSIFQKMKQKSLSHVDGLHDLFGLRVLVSSIEECYRVLGIVHRIGHPVAIRFKDFIAFPKPNGYQSLHTTVTRLPEVPEGIFLEVQVRTHDMHREAEFGIAAHWSYKQGSAVRMAEWLQLQHVLSGQYPVDGEENPSYRDHIFVLTPRGDIVELPEGATPLDFAFQIHTDLGLSFKGARVNGAIVALDYPLENGDIVEIIRHKEPRPSPEWLQLLKMASSRSRLKRYLYSLERTKFIAKGRALANVELRKRGVPPLDPDLKLLRLYDGRALSLAEREDILFKFGQGSERVSTVLPHFDRIRALKPTIERELEPALVRMPRLQRKDALIEIEGGLTMPLRYAKCCSPQENMGSPIIGCVGRTGEVTVHAKKCRMWKNSNPERRIGVRWRKA